MTETDQVEVIESNPTARRNLIIWILGLVSVFGLFDAIILTVEHYSSLYLPCSLTQGCPTVLASKYATIGPIPTAALGIVFYGVILFAVVFALSNQSKIPRLPLLIWSTIGFVSSLGLTYIQGFIIHAWCQYCLLSGLSSTIIFILAIIYYLKHNKRRHNHA